MHPLAEPNEPDASLRSSVNRPAALDDYLGGFTDSVDTAGLASETEGNPSSEDEFARFLDTVLLLRQTAAAEGIVGVRGLSVSPQSIGRHTLFGLAGEGGFSTVWRGFDTVLRRPVAVKLRRKEHLLSEDARRRFIREAEIAARLVHPHIVTVFEVGEDNGREFIATEFCAGGSLADWLLAHPGPMEPKVAARLLRALATAVAHAHAAGVIHRDIKPGNVMLTTTATGYEPLLSAAGAASNSACCGEGLTVKLGDFGLGKLQTEYEASEPLTQLTRAGTTIGTPAWIAPEQVDRSFGEVGPATDVHGLGLLLYRLLVGRDLRGGRTACEIYHQVLVDEPSHLGLLVGGRSKDLAAVTTKCLAKHASARYASVDHLVAELDRWLAGQPTVARPVSVAAKAYQSVLRRPIVSGLAVVALVASLAAGWAAWERIHEERQKANREAEILQQQAVAELRRGFEAVRAGNVSEAMAHYRATASLDRGLADSLAARWLVRRLHGEREILFGHDPIHSANAPPISPPDFYSIALSPNGDTAAVAAADGRVHLLRGLLSGGDAVDSVLAHSEVNEVVFSADGLLMATVGQDGMLRWWSLDADRLQQLGEASLDAGPLYAVAFAPDGRSLVAGGEDRIVRLVRLDAPENPKQLFEFAPPPDESPEIESALFIDDARVAVACGDTIAIIATASGSLERVCQRPFQGNRNAVYGSLTITTDGRQIMACGTDASAHIWAVDTGTLILSLPQHPGWVQGCAFSVDGSRVATACRDGSVRVFDTATGSLLNRLLGHIGRVWSVVWEPGGTLLTSGADGTVRRWAPEAGIDTAMTESISALNGPGVKVIPCPLQHVEHADRNPLEVYSYSPGGSLWRANLESLNARIVELPKGIRPLRADIDWFRRRLVVCQEHGNFSVLTSLDHMDDVVSLVPFELPLGTDARDLKAAWTPAGDLLICNTQGLLFWCPSDLSQIHQIGSFEGPIHDMIVAPAGPPRVAGFGQRVIIYSLPRSGSSIPRREQPVIIPLDIEVTAAAWSPDGRMIACGARTGSLHVYDPTSAAPLGTLTPHERMVEQLVFSTDSRIIISADRDVVRISDALTLTTFDELCPGLEIEDFCLVGNETRLVIAGTSAQQNPTRLAQLLVMVLGSHEVTAR